MRRAAALSRPLDRAWDLHLVVGAWRSSVDGCSPAERNRRSLVEQHLQSGCLKRTPGCVVKHGASLLRGDAGKPLEKVVHRRIILKVLEQRRNLHARAAKDPGPTDAGRVALDCRAC